jgi:hypothetical protein
VGRVPPWWPGEVPLRRDEDGTRRDFDEPNNEVHSIGEETVKSSLAWSIYACGPMLLAAMALSAVVVVAVLLMWPKTTRRLVLATVSAFLPLAAGLGAILQNATWCWEAQRTLQPDDSQAAAIMLQAGRHQMNVCITMTILGFLLPVLLAVIVYTCGMKRNDRSASRIRRVPRRS